MVSKSERRIQNYTGRSEQTGEEIAIFFPQWVLLVISIELPKKIQRICKTNFFLKPTISINEMNDIFISQNASENKE